MNTDPHTDRTKPVVIIEAGYEGGSLTLLGIRTDDAWRFRIATDEGTIYDLLSDEDRAGTTPSDYRRKSDWLDTWDEVLALLNEKQWHMMSPREVHPEFRQQVWAAVQARAASKRVRDPEHARWIRRKLDQWRRVCHGEPLFPRDGMTIDLPRR
jgi:hypothetical protein